MASRGQGKPGPRRSRHGAEDGAEPAQDDHHQEIDGEEHVEGIRREEPDHEGKEASGHPCVEGRQYEGDGLVRGRVDAAAQDDRDRRSAEERPAQR